MLRTVARSPAAVAAALQGFLALEAKGWKGAAGTALIQPRPRQLIERDEGNERDQEGAADHGGGPHHCTLAVVLSISLAAVMTLEFIS